MFGGDFGLPPGPRYGRRSTGGAPPVAYLCHAVAPRRSSCRIVELVQRLRLRQYTLLKAHLANIRSTSGLPKLDPFSLYVGGIGKRRGE